MGVTWTQADIDALQAAIASGVLTVSYDGPPRRQITYKSTSEMVQVLALMNRQVSATPSHRHAKFSRGFDDTSSEG